MDSGLAEKCTIHLSYAIGVALIIDLCRHILRQVSEEQIEKAVSDCMDLTHDIRTHLGLNKPIYQRGYLLPFGRAPDADGGFGWGRTDLIDALKVAV